MRGERETERDGLQFLASKGPTCLIEVDESGVHDNHSEIDKPLLLKTTQTTIGLNWNK
jgi:hypothetical protein